MSGCPGDDACMTPTPPRPTTSDRSPSARRRALARAYEHAAEVAATVRPDQLGLPTPCPDMDVAALLSHLVGAGHRAASLGRGVPPGGVEAFPAVELADVPGELRAAAATSAGGWDDATLAAEVTMPWGEAYSGATLLAMYVAELVTHTWDVAVATDQVDRLDPAVGEAGLGAAREVIRPEHRDLAGPGSPFGQERAAPEGAGAFDRLAAFTGRAR